MDDLLADALDYTDAATDDRTVPPYHDVKTCWETRTVKVLADLGLSDTQIARYLGTSEARITALHGCR
jgi:hypothetical protein